MTTTLVIPGRNASATIRQCLQAVTPFVESGELAEIIFVDDGSTDNTREIVAEFPVKCVPGLGRGPASARNLGWQTAQTDLVWFVDSDCVAEPNALAPLLARFKEEADGEKKLGGVSGSYGNMRPDSLLACLMHEEIIARHRSMPPIVNFLATFNVVYRREALERVGGFDERFLKGQDAELSWRVMDAGYTLGFEFDSRVAHFHETRWLGYFKTQRQQGYWRLWLHLTHKGHSTGDSYSSAVDHIQPPLAMLILAAIPTVFFAPTRWIAPILVMLLLLTQIPMTVRILKQTGKLRYVAFAGMSFLRAFWRGVGLSHATIDYVLAGKEKRTTKPKNTVQPKA
ncbi:MAG: glycosyltransferase [Planctomycetes bacterium]|nr:glycosyltransferase [Planctomycetota bacterium]